MHLWYTNLIMTTLGTDNVTYVHAAAVDGHAVAVDGHAVAVDGHAERWNRF